MIENIAGRIYIGGLTYSLLLFHILLDLVASHFMTILLGDLLTFLGLIREHG
jgi:hypothetical protein